MANTQHLQLLLQSCRQNNCNTQWNTWRKQNSKEIVDLSQANLSGYNLSHANFHNVIFDRCYFKDTVFDHCNLRESSFIKCYVSQSSFCNSDLRDTCIEKSHFIHTHFLQTNMQQIQVVESDLRACIFDDVRLKKANFVKVDLSCSCISNVIGSGVAFREGKCTQITLSGKHIVIHSCKHLDLLHKWFRESKKRDRLMGFLLQEKAVQENKKSLPTSQNTNDEKHIELVDVDMDILDEVPELSAPNVPKEIAHVTHHKKMNMYIVSLGTFLLILVVLFGFFYRQKVTFWVLNYKLHHQNPKVRYEAISSLKNASRATQSDPYVIKILISRLNEKVPKVRKKVLKVLNMIHRPALKYLLEVLYFGDKQRRLAALEIVAGMHGEGIAAVPIIYELLQSSDRDLRLQATKTAYRMGHFASDVTPILIKNLEIKDNELIVFTIKAVSKMRFSFLAQSHIVRHLQSQDDKVFGQAALAIAGGDNLPPEVIPLLTKRLIETQNLLLKNRILFSLGQLAENMNIDMAMDYVVKYAHAKNYKLSYHAMQVLGRAKKVNIIKRLLRSEKSQVREFIISSFILLDEDKKPAIDVFIEAMMQETKRNVLVEQLKALRHIGKHPQLESFLMNKADSSKDLDIRCQCISGLGYTGNSSQAIEWLLNTIMEDFSSDVRSTAFRALRNMDVGKVVFQIKKLWRAGKDKKILLGILQQQIDHTHSGILDLVLPLVDHPDVLIRSAVLNIIFKSDFRKVNWEEIIVSGLLDKNIHVRRRATALFVNTKLKRTNKTTEIFLQNITHEDNKLRLFTLNALIRTGYRDKVLFQKLKKDPYHQVPNLILKVEKLMAIEESLKW